MSRATDGIDHLAAGFAGRGVTCVRERFLLPASPRISTGAGFAIGAAGAFLLSSGRPAASFLVSIAGAILLLLDSFGFSPLNWLGSREERVVLVVPGDPSAAPAHPAPGDPRPAAGRRRALFFGVPLDCAATAAFGPSRRERLLRFMRFSGFTGSLLLPLLPGAVLLAFLPPVPAAGAAAGAAMLLAAAASTRPDRTGPAPRNEAAALADRLVFPPGPGARPYLLLYSGDPEEVKFFLAKYRGELFRGDGIFLELPEGSNGEPAVSVAEGPFVPYRVDPGLLALLDEAGAARGLPVVRRCVLRDKSPGLFAMARGFRTATVFRAEPPSSGRGAAAGEERVPGWPDARGRRDARDGRERPALTDETAVAWLREVAGRHPGRGGRPDSV